MEYPSIAAQFSDADLLNYSTKHLKYELEMFFNTGLQLSRIQLSEECSPPQSQKNALIESFVTHLRNLLCFLYPHGTQKSDVISDYYFSDSITDWKLKRPRESELLKDARQRASREISHLTVYRRTVSKDWPIAELMKEIEPVLKVFVENASGSKLDASVRALLDSVDLQGIVRDPRNASTTIPNSTVVVGNVSTATNHPGIIRSTIVPPSDEMD